jgi:hypothetical protein
MYIVQYSVWVWNIKGYNRTFCILDKDCIDTEREWDMIGKEERLMYKEGIFLPTSVIVSLWIWISKTGLDFLVSSLYEWTTIVFGLESRD